MNHIKSIHNPFQVNGENPILQSFVSVAMMFFIIFVFHIIERILRNIYLEIQKIQNYNNISQFA